MKCVKCGKVLQLVFAGIAADFKFPVEVKDKEGHVISWLVCNNPSCEIGRLNCAVPEPDNLPF